jgi:exopolysaccharide biosynthesis protein
MQPGHDAHAPEASPEVCGDAASAAACAQSTVAFSPQCCIPSGRSAVGLSRGGRVLYLAAASRSTTGQMARTLQKLGVDDALALDGSGSSQMYVKGRKNKGMVKSGDRRKVANAILVSTG